MARTDGYLNFNGNCREALTFYLGCFGGELTMHSVAESGIADQMPAEAAQHIVHGTLTSSTGVIHGSDMLSGTLNPGNNVSLLVNCDSEEHINSLFAKLTEGGPESSPPAESFWGSIFCHITDKFGLIWLLDYDKNTAASA